MKVLIGLLLLFAAIGYFRTRATAQSSSSTVHSDVAMGYSMPDDAVSASYADDDDGDQQQDSEEDFLARERAMHHGSDHDDQLTCGNADSSF